VPHSRATEVESDDLHDHPVWKVTLITRHGRAVVDVDRRTGKATIVSRNGSGGGGRDHHRRGHHDGDQHDGGNGTRDH
jgi:hypothetical protein